MYYIIVGIDEAAHIALRRLLQVQYNKSRQPSLKLRNSLSLHLGQTDI